jgi:hypothetical protein
LEPEEELKFAQQRQNMGKNLSFHLWMLIVSMPLFQRWESLEPTSKRLISQHQYGLTHGCRI